VTPFRIPVFAVRNGQVSVRYARAGFVAGHHELGIPFSDKEVEAIDLFDEIAREPGNHITFPLEAGDLNVINNYVVMHARKAFEDYDEPARKRRLLRIWLDEQSLRSGWDRDWAAHFGGCDGYGSAGVTCRSDLAGRTSPDWSPVALVPKENPYYVGLPYNDLDDLAGRAASPWAHDPGYAQHLADPAFSLLKNRWVQVTGSTGSCYAQVEDTGPGPSDAGYVLGAARPGHTPAINLSPAVARCIGVTDAATGIRVDWAFVDRPPTGPWTAVLTTRQSDPDGRRR